MKRCLVLLLVVLFSGLGAQIFEGGISVQDREGVYLNQVLITNISSQTTVLADVKGNFKIPAKNGDVLRFTSAFTERKDLKVSEKNLSGAKNMVQLAMNYHEIRELVLTKFKPSGNLRKDVYALKSKDRSLEIQQIIGLPAPKGDGTPATQPIASLANGGMSLSVDAIYDAISGDAKKKQRLYDYEKMVRGISTIRSYFGDSYFTNLKIPQDRVENFLTFVYTSENIDHFVQSNNLEAVKVPIEKYLPIYQKRLEDSELARATDKG